MDGADLGLYVDLLFATQNRLALVVERAAGKACYLEQVRQLVVTPQPGNQTRFVDATDLFARIKACSFFRYATSARGRVFSSHKVWAESVMTGLGGAGQHRSGFLLGCPCFLLPRTSTPPSTSLRRQTTTWFGLRMS